MKKTVFCLLISIISFGSFSQIEGSEIGFDVTANASNFNGTVGIGLKYGFNFNENFIAGPSLRYHRYWFNSATSNIKGGYNILGGGAFIHARLYDYFYLGSEFEILHSPINFGASANPKKWVPVLLVGGGFSMMIAEKLRFNAGLMYDLLDIQNLQNPNNVNPNSPLQPYIRVSQKKLVPLLYRISFFIPISGK